MALQTLQLPLSFPADPSRRACCARCLEERLATRPGIRRVRILTDDPEFEGPQPRATIQFDYDNELLSLTQINNYLRAAGSCLEHRPSLVVLPVDGLVSPRQCQAIQDALSKLPGVNATACFGSQTVRLEYQRQRAALPEIVRRMDRLGVRLRRFGGEGKAAGAAPDTTPPPRFDLGPEWLRAALRAPDVLLAAAAGVLLLAGALVHYFDGPGLLRLLFTGGAFACGAWFPGRDLVALLARVRGLRTIPLDVDVLMFLAAFGAAALGHYEEGALLLFLFSVGGAGERLAMNRARRAIQALQRLAPKTATRLSPSGEQQEVRVEELRVDDLVLVRPGQQVPCDGQVLAGASAVDQAPITGESAPVDKGVGDEVFAGTLNGAGALTIRVNKLAVDNTLAKVIRLVEEAQTTKSPTQQFTDRVERWYVPLVIGATALLVVVPPLLGIVPRREHSSLWAGWFYQAMAFLTAASPCALAIGTPAAILSGIGRAARGGMLIKGGVHLENLGRVQAIAFDKTGTLTRGRPEVTDILPLAPGLDAHQLLGLAAAVEATSHHPIAEAIVQEAKGRECLIPLAAEVEQTPGLGIRGRVNGQRLTIGRMSLFEPSALEAALEEVEGQAGGPGPSAAAFDGHVASATADSAAPEPPESPEGRSADRGTCPGSVAPATADSGAEYRPSAGRGTPLPACLRRLSEAKELAEKLEGQGRTVVVVADEMTVLGVVGLADRPRPGMKKMMKELKRLGVRRTIMLTGDNRRAAAAVAAEVGVDEHLAELLPEDKLTRMRELERRYGRVAMVGDGVNDAPAMASASVGIAIGGASGGGSDVALETADVALLGADMHKLPEALGVSRYARRIVVQNLVLALGVIVVLAPLAALGMTPISAAVFFHEGSTVLVVLNGLRILGWRARGA